MGVVCSKYSSSMRTRVRTAMKKKMIINWTSLSLENRILHINAMQIKTTTTDGNAMNRISRAYKIIEE